MPNIEKKYIENLIDELNISQTLEAPDFKNITDLAKKIFNLPYAYITYLNGKNLFITSGQEFSLVKIPLEKSFCAHAIKSPNVLVVENALSDDRFCNNIFVSGEDNYRFYAGAPLDLGDGLRIGTLCLMGHEVRHFTQEEAATLTLMADQVVSLIKLHKIAHDNAKQANDLEIASKMAHQAELMVRTMHDGLTIQNLDGDLVFANPSASRILGYSNEQLLQKSSRDDWSAVDEKGNEIGWRDHPSMRALHEDKAIENAVIGVNHPDGSRVWLQISAIPIMEKENSKPQNVLVTFVDISQTKFQEEKLRELSIKADSANRAKSSFLANMSHEIRTPLNGVLGIAAALERTNLDDNQREMLSIINSSGFTLAALLNDILDLSKIESGIFKLENNFEEPRKIIENSIALFDANAAAKNIEIKLINKIPEGLFLSLDKVRIRQVLSNLIGNAVKFTQEGGVIVAAHFEANVNGKTGKLRIEIIDSGPGFDAQTKQSLFGRFVQADDSISRKYGGTGLGLSICKSLINLMGGKIDCTSEVGVGSCFWFEADFELKKEIEIDNKVKANFHGSNNLQKILIAEDNLTNQKVLKHLLVEFDLELEFAPNGKEAIKLFETGDFDLILMDTQMPIMGGNECTKLIRQIEKNKNLLRTPIINLSANIMKEQIDECIEAGCDDFIEKPINSAELFAKIDKWIDTKSAKRLEKAA